MSGQEKGVPLRAPSAARAETFRMSDYTETLKAWYSYAELQERWGVCKRTIQREVQRGRLRRSYTSRG
jgi:IS30 family transposase